MEGRGSFPEARAVFSLSNPSPCGGSVCLLGMEQVGKDPLLSRPPALPTT